MQLLNGGDNFMGRWSSKAARISLSVGRYLEGKNKQNLVVRGGGDLSSGDGIRSENPGFRFWWPALLLNYVQAASGDGRNGGNHEQVRLCNSGENLNTHGCNRW